MKQADKYWQRRVKDVNSGLFIVWNGLFNRWQILHKCQRTAQIRKVLFVNSPDGGYMDLNDNVIWQLKKGVRWDLVNRFEHVTDMLDEVDRENNLIQEALRRKRRDDVNVVCHEDRHLWAQALEEVRSGRYGHVKKPGKKIMVDLGGE